MTAFKPNVANFDVIDAQDTRLICWQKLTVKRPGQTYKFGSKKSHGFHTISMAAYKVTFAEMQAGDWLLDREFHYFIRVLKELSQTSLNNWSGECDQGRFNWMMKLMELWERTDNSYKRYSQSPRDRSSKATYLSDVLRLIHFFPFVVIPTEDARDDRGAEVNEAKKSLEGSYCGARNKRQLVESIHESLDDLVREKVVYTYYDDPVRFFAGLIGLIYLVSLPWFRMHQRGQCTTFMQFLSQEKGSMVQYVLQEYAPPVILQKAVTLLESKFR